MRPKREYICKRCGARYQAGSVSKYCPDCRRPAVLERLRRKYAEMSREEKREELEFRRAKYGIKPSSAKPCGHPTPGRFLVCKACKRARHAAYVKARYVSQKSQLGGKAKSGPRNCLQCGGAFIAYRGTHVFCSDKCQKVRYRQKDTFKLVSPSREQAKESLKELKSSARHLLGDSTCTTNQTNPTNPKP